ncbi:MAG: hypothetical protein LBL15_01725 [Oscillospiraceae bacterium]|nr:hypothetical protein [Oscillospiraceae bacterium]
MDKSKIKSSIIILLAVVNVCLLALVFSDNTETRKARLYRQEALEAVFAENGIAFDPATAIPDTAPPLMTLRRDVETEEKSFRALIGRASVEDQGGNVFFFLGTAGQAQSRGTGEFELMLLEADPIAAGKDAVSAAEAAMKKLGYECADIAPAVTWDSSSTLVTLVCAQDGIPVRNARISFYFLAGRLQTISGAGPLDKKIAASAAADYPDGITVLMKFLELINQTGRVCGRVNGVGVEYVMSSAVSGSCTLRPVWHIEADSGSFFIDAATLKEENIEASA